ANRAHVMHYPIASDTLICCDHGMRGEARASGTASALFGTSLLQLGLHNEVEN
nr:hypothetical protein [Tanacetum cinerariifolium]